MSTVNIEHRFLQFGFISEIVSFGKLQSKCGRHITIAEKAVKTSGKFSASIVEKDIDSCSAQRIAGLTWKLFLSKTPLGCS